jgi:A/G-specific adenine glycosylase
MSTEGFHPDISAAIVRWYEEHRRELPWRFTRDPYLIWLSEIILQQTRVVQGLDYYNRFAARFPTVADLAAASDDEVMKLWQGLGYYSRARHLHEAAQQVMREWGGRFPTAYDDLRRLSGVGPYTAAAIASFSADEAVAVVDGNVYRVLSRLFDLDTPIDSTPGAKLFQAMANELLDHNHPGRHNQAMMELGALVCTPTSPDCTHCPVQERCAALLSGTIEQRPVKQQRIKVRPRYLHYLILRYDDLLWMHRRGAGDIWQGLYEFPLIERNANTPPTELLNILLTAEGLDAVSAVTPLMLGVKHRLTHQLLTVDFHIVQLHRILKNSELRSKNDEFQIVTVKEWLKLAVPKLISDVNSKLFE